MNNKNELHADKTLEQPTPRGRLHCIASLGCLADGPQADFHRTLLKGGVFLYPPTTDFPQGKLRLLYEANPIAFIATQAGGQASDGRGPVLDIRPQSIHQRTPFIVGGTTEMQAFEEMIGSAPPMSSPIR